MSEQSKFLSEALASCVVQQPTLVADLLRSVGVDDLDPPYSHVVAAVSRSSVTEQVDLLALQHTVAQTYPGLPGAFIPDLVFHGALVAQFPSYLAGMREGVARRRFGSVAALVQQAANSSDLTLGFERVKEAVADAQAVLRPVPLTLLDTPLWDYQPPAEAVLIPNLLWRQARGMITGFEGHGKSVVLRQLALAGALGIHPFKPNAKVEPIRTLLIDLENPRVMVDLSMHRMLRTLVGRGHVADHDPCLGEHFRYQVQGPLDIINRGRDRDFLNRAVDTWHPDLLCIGPIYHLAAAGGNLDEAQAGFVTDFLTNMTKAHDVAIISEAHAVKGVTTADPRYERPLAPSGSGVWMRFPEFGRGLRFQKKASDYLNRTVYRLERWRRDRVPDMKLPEYIGQGKGEAVWFNDVTDDVAVYATE